MVQLALCCDGDAGAGTGAALNRLHTACTGQVLWARPWTAVAFAHDNPLKLSETLKEVYCNVNNLSLAASVFLILAGAGCPLWPLPRTHMPRAALPLMLPKPANEEGQVGAFLSWMWGLEQVSWPPVGVSGLTVRTRHRAL